MSRLIVACLAAVTLAGPVFADRGDNAWRRGGDGGDPARGYPRGDMPRPVYGQPPPPTQPQFPGGDRRLSPDERQQLRRDMRDAARDLYGERGWRR